MSNFFDPGIFVPILSEQQKARLNEIRQFCSESCSRFQSLDNFTDNHAWSALCEAADAIKEVFAAAHRAELALCGAHAWANRPELLCPAKPDEGEKESWRQ
jgi:hypothetical protein